jgi:hypothetical protein
MTFNSRLIDLLKSDQRFVDDEGELVLAAVQDSAWKLDHDLIRLLLSDEKYGEPQKLDHRLRCNQLQS